MRLGVDLGGTKIEAAVLAADGAIVWRERVATPREDYDGTIAAIAALVARGEDAVDARCPVGLAIPGAISAATGRIKNANSTWLNGRAFQEDVTRVLARDIRMANDANCLAVSEATDGAAAGAAVVFAAILGTGTGGGVWAHGRVVAGANGIGGEWGHNPLPQPTDDERPGPACYCGRRGCIETFLSGPGLAADYARRSGAEGVTGEDVARRAEAGDAAAEAALAAWEDRAARAFGSIINVLDPDVIVVGGGLSKMARMYENVPARWGAYVFSDRVDTRFVPAKHGDASGVRGAAWLWNESANV